MTAHLLCVGGEDHALRIPFLSALSDRGFQVSVAGSGDPTAFSRRGIAFHHFGFDRFGLGIANCAAIGNLARLFRAVRPDLIQTFDTKPNLFVPFAARGAFPVVRTINGMGWTFSSTNLRALALRPAYVALQRLASSWTAATVFQNRDDQDYFCRNHLLGRSFASLIGSSGIDTKAFEEASASDKSADLRTEFDVGNAAVVLMVSRLTVQKGIHTLLEAAAIVNREHPNARFLLVGPRESEGPFAIHQAEIDRCSPYVIATGPRPDVASLLKLADVFVYPTEYREGVPRALLEAGIMGLPIVATKMPGCTDVVTDQWNGYLVDPRDPQALAARILDLLRDPVRAHAMGRRSVALVRDNHDIQVVAKRYDDLYRKVLSSRQDNTAPMQIPAVLNETSYRRDPGTS